MIRFCSEMEPQNLFVATFTIVSLLVRARRMKNTRTPRGLPTEKVCLIASYKPIIGASGMNVVVNRSRYLTRSTISFLCESLHLRIGGGFHLNEIVCVCGLGSLADKCSLKPFQNLNLRNYWGLNRFRKSTVISSPP